MAKIMIVDDMFFVRHVLRKFLEKADHNIVAEAATAEEAVMLYKSIRPDIVTMDIVLQEDENGLAALEQIRQFDSSAKVIMISAHGHVDVVKYAMSLGSIGFIHKPADGELLKKLINEAMAAPEKQLAN